MESVHAAVILCGGAGTRIRPLFPDLPKALIPVAGRPFIEWQVAALATSGIRRIFLAAGHHGDQLIKWLDDWHRRVNAEAPEIRVTIEPRPLGTAGALRYLATELDTPTVLVLNGDSLAPNLSFQGLEASWNVYSKAWKTIALNLPSLGRNDAATFQALEVRGAAMAVTPVPSAGRFGTVEFAPDGRVTAFREKSERDTGWVNAGVYLLHTALLQALPPDTPLSLERDVFPALADAGLLHTFSVPPPLLDLGTPEGLREMESSLRHSPLRANVAQK